MSVLARNEIIQAIDEGKLSFTPKLDAFQIQPHAIDLRLGWTFYIPKSWVLNKNGRQAMNIDYLNISEDKNSFDIIKLEPGQYFEILPNESIIAVTLETVSIKNLQLMAVLYPRSSFNRRGLSVSLTGIIDAGYTGTLMIPIRNNTTNHVIKIYPGERVCQLLFEELSSELTKEQAYQHGLLQPKYMNSDESSITYKKDTTKKEASDEIHLIRNGKIDDIKNLYKI